MNPMLSRFDLPFMVSIVLGTIYNKNNIYKTVNLVTIGVCFECCSIGFPAKQIVTEVAGFDECILVVKVYIEICARYLREFLPFAYPLNDIL